MIPYTESSTSVIEAMDGSEMGLSQAEARDRLRTHGANTLPSRERRGPWLRFLLQFQNPLIYVLLAAAAVTFWMEHHIDAGVILGVVIINAVIGFVQEGKAEKALEAVRAMLATHATVLRDGERQEVDATELVPGDIVLLESGAKIPADLRLIDVKNLRVNEAALTGESVPAEKQTQPVHASAPVGDRTCMAYSGTVVTYGQGRGVVVATGSNAEIGRIGTMVAGVESLVTPLTLKLDQFARQITFVILCLGLLTFLYGHYVADMLALDIFLAVVGLAVAAIPEGLPAIVTITLAIGTRIMARHRAIVRRLPAVETLGSVSIICTDKTGTLTKNEMTAVHLMLPDRDLEVSGAGYRPEGGFHADGHAVDPRDQADIQRLCRCALLCNDAKLQRGEEGDRRMTGDPTEGALLVLAVKAGLDPTNMASDLPRIDEVPFESEHRYMATLHHDHEGGAYILLKGAPERILELCKEDMEGKPLDRNSWLARMEAAAAQGRRILALAECEVAPNTTALGTADISPRFTLLGLVGMIDPPRPEAVEAVESCRRAGIRVIMITGDHAITAAAIGGDLGLAAEMPLTGEQIDRLDDAALRQRLEDTDVVARASPEHKLRLVAVLQAEGALVAMTGDGVNDAPALKSANIGVAMGGRGTDAAKEAADLVLTDDNFATIAQAVQQGRTVFDNIKKSLIFILPTNGGEAGVILLAVFVGLALPITAAQILWINMVTAITLALALGFEPAEPGVMNRPPRPPEEPLITRLLLVRIIYVSLLMVAVAFIAYEWELARGSGIDTARTAVVNALVFGELVYLFNTRYFTRHAFSANIIYGNPVAFWASVILIGLQVLFTYAPPMQHLFHTTALDASSWALILALSTGKFLAVEAEKWLLRRRRVVRM